MTCFGDMAPERCGKEANLRATRQLQQGSLFSVQVSRALHWLSKRWKREAGQPEEDTAGLQARRLIPPSAPWSGYLFLV